MRTKEQNANLEKLANYLLALPEDYEHFDMGNFYYLEGFDEFTVPELRSANNYKELIKLNKCGTAACAVGHGPAAGIPLLNFKSWWSYSNKSFTGNDLEWAWCFGGEWEGVDDTPKGAGVRIKALLGGYSLNELDINAITEGYYLEALEEKYL